MRDSKLRGSRTRSSGAGTSRTLNSRVCRKKGRNTGTRSSKNAARQEAAGS